MIKGKHLGKAFSVDMKTGKETPLKNSMMMLPARKGTCPECAVDHKPEAPHDAGSLFYQYKFYNEHGRWPKWSDAMNHCDENTRTLWWEELLKRGVRVT